MLWNHWLEDPPKPPTQVTDIDMRILVGIDEYPESAAALRSAAELSNTLSAELSIVHAAPMIRLAAFSVPDLPALRRDALTTISSVLRDRIGEWLKGSSWEGRDLSANLRVVEGEPAQVLADEIDECGADMLMIGPHRKHGLLDFGNTMRKTFALAGKSIWVQVGEWKEPKVILAPIDLSAVGEAVMEHARDLANSFDARVEVIYCFPEPLFGYQSTWPDPGMMPTYVIDKIKAESLEKFEKAVDRFDWRGVAHDMSFVESQPVAGISEAAKGCDLIVMGQHGEGWLSSTVMGSTAYAVLKHAPCSVLALRHIKTD